MAKFTADEILRVLDSAAAAYEFPILDNGYTYLVDVRLSAYGDEARWAILIEIMGVMARAQGFDNFIYAFGNCLTPTRTSANFATEEAWLTWRDRHVLWDSMSVSPVESEGLLDEAPKEDDDEWTEEDPDDERWQCDLPLRRDAEDFKIRDRTVRVPDVRHYQDRHIRLEHDPHVQLHELMRFVAEDYRALLVATEEELRALIPGDLPLLLRLDEWWHPDCANDEKPSETETFRMIADVLATGDRKRWKPPVEPNTHWSNWPNGGTL